jgi:hypothetical protein
MHPVAEHPIPSGPLAVRWLAWTMQQPRAGALARARIVLENAGSAQWRDVKLAYHWLDELGNPIFWDGLRSDLLPLQPGTRVEADARVRALIPPGSYRLAFDLVIEGRYWFSEVGNATLDLETEIVPRDAAQAVAHLTRDVEPADDWHARVRAAHEEGYAAVAGSIARLPGYEPGGGRNPGFDRPLVCPSLLPPLEPNTEVAGLPAWKPEGDEPWIYDAGITARLRSGRRRA